MDYINGFLLGMTLQLSLGPVFFAILHKAITENGLEAFKMSMGAACVDTFYIALSFTGIALILQVQATQSILLVFGGIVLIYFGLKYIKKAGGKNSRSISFQETTNLREDKKKNSSFAYGVKLTAINPLTIVFWSGTFSALLASGALSGLKGSLLFSAGCISATVFFLGVISFIAPLLQLKRNFKLERAFDYIVGAVLILFGLFMLSRLILN